MLLGIEGFKKTVLLMTNFNISTNAGHIAPNNCASICCCHLFIFQSKFRMQKYTEQVSCNSGKLKSLLVKISSSAET
jgi:hypothetical protein